MGTMVSMGPDSGVVDSLLSKVDAAHVAFDRKQPSIAVQLLQTFIQEVQAQKGKQIKAERASYLTTQAQTVIDAIMTAKGVKPAFMKVGLPSRQYIESATQPTSGVAGGQALGVTAALDPRIKA